MTEAKIVTVTAANGQDMTADLENFGRIIGLDQAAPERYSMLPFSGYTSGCSQVFCIRPR